MKLKLNIKLVIQGFLVIAMLWAIGANAQVTNLEMSAFGSADYRLSWDWSSSSPPDKYLIVIKQGAPETMLPVDGQTYTSGQSFGGGQVLFVIPGTASDGFTPIEGIFFSRTNLPLEGTDYWFTMYPYSDIGPDYTTTSPGEVAFVTPGIVEEPMMQPSNATHSVGESDGSKRTITFSYDRSPYELGIPFEARYLVVYKVGSPITYIPTDGAPDVTFGTASLSDGSKGRLDQGTDNETVSIDVTGSEQTVYFKIFALHKAHFDYSIETSPSYNYLTIDPLEFTATIPAEANTAPTVNDETFSIDENASNGTLVGTVSASDPQNDPLTFSITAGNDNSAFTIDASTGEITVSNSTVLDFETTPIFNLTVEVSDGTLSDNAVITINLNDVEENVGPSMEDQAFSVDEDASMGSSVGTIVASDPENDPLSYSILSGNINNSFLLNTSSGEILVNAALDFSTTPTYNLEVEVSDGDLYDMATITINVNEISENLGPSMNDQVFSVDENASISSSVGTIVASDPENDPLSFSILSGNTNNSFLLNTSSGEILVNAALDFSTTPTYNLEVEVSDGSLYDMAIITINVNEQASNSAPVIMDQSFSIEENSANDEVVGIVTATDVDNDPLTFSIISGNTNNAFSLEASTGEILVATSASLDFETTPSFTLLVSVSDGQLTDVANITIDLLDVAENGAPIISAQTFSLDENSSNGTSVGMVEASDAENDPITFSIESGNQGDAFLIVGSTGELLVINNTELDFESTPTFTLGIGVSDGSSTSIGEVTINLNDVAETVLGLDIEARPYTIYPNPATTYISLEETINAKRIGIWDVGGKLVDNIEYNNANRYTIEHLKSGTYYLIITTQDEVIRSKLIIK